MPSTSRLLELVGSPKLSLVEISYHSAFRELQQISSSFRNLPKLDKA